MISSFGRYKNFDGVVSTPSISLSGYRSIKCKGKTYLVHVLVAKAFIPNDDPDVKTQINHKDLNPSNNRVNNLEWVSRRENIRHSHVMNKNRKTGASKLSKPIFGRKVGDDDSEWVKYDSSQDAMRKLGISGNIRSCCRGERKTAGGYEFKYDTNANS